MASIFPGALKRAMSKRKTIGTLPFLKLEPISLKDKVKHAVYYPKPEFKIKEF